MQLTQQILMHLMHYDPLTGVWTWLNPPNHNTRLKGQSAGNRRADGYLRIRICGRLYYASHLACLYITGNLPMEEKDHKDRDPSNDKWVNLREATSSENKYNREFNYSDKTRGVYCTGNKWWAMTGRDNYLGTFDTFEEASTARDDAAKELGGDFAILNSNRSTQ